MSPFLLPGAAHPHPPLPAEDLADRLGVPTAEVLSWVKEGLETSGGLIDPFAASNWLCWGRLERCPLLQRRWQSYVRWFLPHVHGEDTPQRYRIRQAHRLYLPRPVDELAWYVPRLPVCSTQAEVRAVSAVTAGAAEPTEHGLAGAFWRLTWKRPVEHVEMACEWAVEVRPRPVDIFPERAELIELVSTLVEEFRYEYRHHGPVEDPRQALTVGVDGIAGSCLDCALELGRRLTARGRDWRLCAGVVASTAVANPHFWLKVDTQAGWVPVDPSLPAIARMLGLEWRGFVDAYVGGCDARRITIAEIDQPVPSVPGGASIGSRLGEVIATVDGQRQNAWACLDWVCGECTWAFH